MIGLGSDKNTHLVSPSTVLYTPQACSHRPTVRGGRALVTAWIVHIARLICISTSEQKCMEIKKHIFSVFYHLPAGSQVGELCDEVVGVRQDPTGEHHHVQGDLDCAVPRPAVRYDMICLVPWPAVLTRQSFLILLRIVKIIKIVKIVKMMRILRDIQQKTTS